MNETIQATFTGVVRFISRRRSSEDRRRFVAYAVGSYFFGKLEWRMAKEFPVGVDPDTVVRAFEPSIICKVETQT